jgi:hypothetical protein
LVKYVGWGAMPQVFDDFNREWAKEETTSGTPHGGRDQVRARDHLNAHYTSPTVIRAMY